MVETAGMETAPEAAAAVDTAGTEELPTAAAVDTAAMAGLTTGEAADSLQTAEMAAIRLADKLARFRVLEAAAATRLTMAGLEAQVPASSSIRRLVTRSDI